MKILLLLLIPFVSNAQPYDTVWFNFTPTITYVLKPISPATLKAMLPIYSLHSPSEGATINIVKNSFNIIDLSTIKTALTLNFPSNPSDKDFVEVKFTLAVTTVTYTGGVIRGGYVAPIAGTTIKFSYVQSSNTWY